MSEEVTKKILKEMEQMSKGGEGSGVKGHKTSEEKKDRKILRTYGNIHDRYDLSDKEANAIERVTPGLSYKQQQKIFDEYQDYMEANK